MEIEKCDGCSGCAGLCVKKEPLVVWPWLWLMDVLMSCKNKSRCSAVTILTNKLTDKPFDETSAINARHNMWAVGKAPWADRLKF